MFHGIKLFPECAINPILFHFSTLSLCFSLFLSRFITIAIAIHCLQGEGKRNTFPRGCVLKKRTSNEKAVPVRGMRSSKYHLDPSIIAPFSSSASSSQQNRLVNSFEWLLSDIFFLHCVSVTLVQRFLFSVS